MSESLIKASTRALEPMERISEVLFALIMVLTFTCSFSVAEPSREEVRTLLVGALGCNLAWGFIDAVFYLMGSFGARGQGLLRLKALDQAQNSDKALEIIAQALPPLVASVLSSSDLEAIHQKLARVSDLPATPQLRKHDWLSAGSVFLVVVLSTLPVILPFIIIENAKLALRASNGIAIAMLFFTGYAFGRHAGHRPLAMGMLMVILGAAMVGITISLGG